MPFADLELSRRLERAEGNACLRYAEARRRLHPESGPEWIECAGAYAVFDGIDSPVTQSFGLGIFEEPTPAALDRIERFFFDRGAPVHLEVSPFAGIPTMNLLCARAYRPIELSNVLHRPIENPPPLEESRIRVRVISRDIGRDKDRNEADLWSDINARGWAHDHPEFREFLLQLGAISAAREDSQCFLAEFDGQPGAAGVLCLHQGTALLGGAATIPELRRRGLQTALLNERMRYAFNQGFDLAMMVTEPGSNSQRNAERKGFRIAYTRTKWKLDPPECDKNSHAARWIST